MFCFFAQLAFLKAPESAIVVERKSENPIGHATKYHDNYSAVFMQVLISPRFTLEVHIITLPDFQVSTSLYGVGSIYISHG